MKKLLASLFFCLLCAAVAAGLSYSRITGIEDLVDSFYRATDLQKSQILNDNLGKEITAAGRVSNVGEYDFFDIVNDIKGTYYQVTLDEQKTKNNVPYQVILLFKDKDKVKDIDRQDNLQKDGKIIRIIDERLQIAVWVFCGELSDKDKGLFNQELNPSD